MKAWTGVTCGFSTSQELCVAHLAKEYHIAVHCSDVAQGWRLLKLHKAASLEEHVKAASVALGLESLPLGAFQKANEM